MVLYKTDVIHTVGPDCGKQGQRPDLLRSSYSACLELMSKNKLRSIAFPCISTGKYKYPSEAACQGKGTTLARYLEVFFTGLVKLIANLASWISSVPLPRCLLSGTWDGQSISQRKLRTCGSRHILPPPVKRHKNLWGENEAFLQYWIRWLADLRALTVHSAKMVVGCIASF